MSESEVHQWTIDFSQAKIALRNLEILMESSAASQIETVSKLKELFTGYSRFAEDGASSTRNADIIEQIKLLTRVEQNMHLSTSKFSGKAKAQLEAARIQVNSLYAPLSKLKSLKAPQYTEAVNTLSQQIPSFLNLFDAFLVRFTLQVRLQQADFYKQLGDAFTHSGRAQAIENIKSAWRSNFDKIMPALEVMKLVNPHVKNSSLLGTTATTHAGGDIPEGPVYTGSRLASATEKVDSVIFAPVKWIHSKMTSDLKHFQFSDPRMGFFSKCTQPPAHKEESVTAAYDFEGQADSDLSFKKGDIIKVVDKGTEDDPNWWCGEFDGRRGLFPFNYVEIKGEKEEQDPNEYIPTTVENKDLTKPKEASTIRADNSTEETPQKTMKASQPHETKVENPIKETRGTNHGEGKLKANLEERKSPATSKDEALESQLQIVQPEPVESGMSSNKSESEPPLMEKPQSVKEEPAETHIKEIAEDENAKSSEKLDSGNTEASEKTHESHSASTEPLGGSDDVGGSAEVLDENVTAQGAAEKQPASVTSGTDIDGGKMSENAEYVISDEDLDHRLSKMDVESGNSGENSAKISSKESGNENPGKDLEITSPEIPSESVPSEDPSLTAVAGTKSKIDISDELV